MIDIERTIRVDVRLRDALESGSLPGQLLVDSAAGTGKTWSILSVLHCLASDYPDLRFLICRQTRSSLTESVMVTFEQEILPSDGMSSVAYGTARRTRQAYNYPNGSTIVLGGMDKPERILSTAWDIVYVNECIEISEEGWDALWGRLNRPGRPAWLGYLIGDTNPSDPSHWLKKRADAGEVGRWQVAHEANPALHDGLGWTPAGRRYLAGLGRLRGTRRKRFLDGVWAAGEGQWFETFTDANVSRLADYDPSYPVHLAVDSGVHTGAVWFQVKGHGSTATVNVFGDLYLYGKSAFDVGNQVIEQTTALGLVGKDERPAFDHGTTDPAGNSRNAAVSVTVISEYRRAGLDLKPWPSYPGSLADGLSLVDSFVSVEPAELTVHPRCTRTIEAFANYKRKKRGGQFIDDPEDPQHPYEDMLDALRGGLMAKFPKGRSYKPGGFSSAGAARPGLRDRTFA